MIYLTPIGFDEAHITAGIVERGLGEDDRVVLITPEANLDDQRFEDARHKVEQLLDQASGASLETLTVDHTDFEDAITTISSFIADQDEPIILNASQAAREILLATVIASMMQREKIEDVILYSDVDRQNLDADLPFIVELTDHDKQVLQELTGEITLSELTEKLGIDKSTVSRRVKRMKERSLLEERREGRKKYVKLSFTGRLYRAILG